MRSFRNKNMKLFPRLLHVDVISISGVVSFVSYFKNCSDYTVLTSFMPDPFKLKVTGITF